MSEKIEIDDRSGVDKGLVAMFLRMSPEERLRANDNAFRTILELRDAYRRQKANECNRKIATSWYPAESKYDLPNS